jgi:hypothetical protein
MLEMDTLKLQLLEVISDKPLPNSDGMEESWDGNGERRTLSLAGSIPLSPLTLDRTPEPILELLKLELPLLDNANASANVRW